MMAKTGTSLDQADLVMFGFQGLVSPCMRRELILPTAQNFTYGLMHNEGNITCYQLQKQRIES